MCIYIYAWLFTPMIHLTIVHTQCVCLDSETMDTHEQSTNGHNLCVHSSFLFLINLQETSALGIFLAAFPIIVCSCGHGPAACWQWQLCLCCGCMGMDWQGGIFTVCSCDHGPTACCWNALFVLCFFVKCISREHIVLKYRQYICWLFS